MGVCWPVSGRPDGLPWCGGWGVGVVPGPVVGQTGPHVRCAHCPPRGLSAPWGGPAVLRPTALRCSAVGRRRGTYCALPGAKLRSDSRAEFDVEVRLTAHRPPPRPALLATGQVASPTPHPPHHLNDGVGARRVGVGVRLGSAGVTELIAACAFL